MVQIFFYVPEQHSSRVKEAMFAAGAGRIGNYDRCSWECAGIGQYRPLEGSQPFQGQQGRTEIVGELKVEMVCADEYLAAALEALRKTHPYETPAFGVLRFTPS